MTSQYSLKLPMALPIACAYSHMMWHLPAVWPEIAKPSPPASAAREPAAPGVRSPSLPRFSSHSTDGYMHESMSASALPRSQWTGRVGSRPFTAAIAWRKQSPCPVSLPIDHIVTDGLLR